MASARSAPLSLALVLVVTVAGAPGAGCGAAPCNSAACAAGNSCIAPAGGAAQCARPCATHTDCPYNYHCDANAGGASPYCVINSTTFPDTPETQFGAPCSPMEGFQDNPACASMYGFWCNATSPDDASAYCTYFGCKTDTDCGGGYYCGQENQFPNAASSQLQNGQTFSVCLPRDYCAPCATDVDCGPVNGVAQHCVAGTGGVTFCGPECTNGSECALDAVCTPYAGYGVCTPRAGVCVGDGSLCAPCRSDADCPAGYCVPAYNSTEHFCATKSGITCSLSSSLQIIDQCPSSTPATPVVSCSLASIEPNFPANLCIGQVQEGVGSNGQPTYVEGCWTVH